MSADAKNGILDLKPVTTRLFGAPGAGSLGADFSGDAPSYQMNFNLKQFPIEEFFRTASLKQRAAGPVDFVAKLTTRGSSIAELRQALAGDVSLHGTGLRFIGSDLDDTFARFESSQTFGLADVGPVFLAGPLGLMVTKGYDFARLSQAGGSSSEIRMLVSEWKLTQGLARAHDVALTTNENRIALRGGLDFARDRFEDVSIALVDAGGCAIVKQRILGSFREPKVEKPNFIMTLTGPALRLLKKGAELVSGEPCDVFYAGSVVAPK